METNNRYPRPTNYLILSIISTACCCLPIGIYAIIRATQVNSQYDAGNYEAAEKASKDAKLWSLIAIGIGIVIGIAYAAFIILLGSDIRL